jgi:hypothetical protein
MQQFFSLLSWRLFTAQHVLGIFPPIIKSSMTAVAVSGFTFVSWWQSCCVRGWTGPTTNTARLSPWYEGKTRGCHCSHWAPDDGRENAQIMLSCKQSQDNKLKNCCIRLVIYLNCTMMHRLTNLKFYNETLAHSVCEMWIIYEPKSVALWNKRHFEEKNRECAACLKYSVLIIVEKNI